MIYAINLGRGEAGRVKEEAVAGLRMPRLPRGRAGIKVDTGRKEMQGENGEESKKRAEKE